MRSTGIEITASLEMHYYLFDRIRASVLTQNLVHPSMWVGSGFDHSLKREKCIFAGRHVSLQGRPVSACDYLSSLASVRPPVCQWQQRTCAELLSSCGNRPSHKNLFCESSLPFGVSKHSLSLVKVSSQSWKFANGCLNTIGDS